MNVIPNDTPRCRSSPEMGAARKHEYACGAAPSHSRRVFASRGSQPVVGANTTDPADCKVCRVPPGDDMTTRLTPHKPDRVQLRLRVR